MDGHTVVGCSSCAAALAKVGSFEPDVVVTDIHMPDIDGYELAKRIRESYGARPILIACTGTNADYRDALVSGFNHFLTKPYRPETLAQLLERIAVELPRPA